MSSNESKNLKKTYLQLCKAHKAEPLSSIKEAFRKMVKKCLNLSSVYLSDEQAQCLGQTLVKWSTVVSELLLADCSIKDQGLSSLICGFDTLAAINLKGNELIECGSELGAFLKATKTVTSLNLEWNSIGSSESSLAALSEGIAINTSLLHLNLSHNHISHCGASFIASALATNETLVKLDLDWNSVGVLGARQLLASLKLNTCLEELHLTGNNITNDLLEAIGTTLSVKSRHNHDKKEWTAQRDFMLTENELKQQETHLKVSCLYDQLDEMRMSSMGLTEKAREEILSYKAEIESCYSKITYLEDQLLTAKSALETVESQRSTLQEEYEALVQLTEDKMAAQESVVQEREREISLLRDNMKQLEQEKTCTGHDLQQKIKLLCIEKEASTELVEGLKQELLSVKESKATRIRELEEDMNELSRTNTEQLQKARATFQLDLSQSQALWDKEKSSLTEQLQAAMKKCQELKQEHEVLDGQLNSDRAKASQAMDQMKRELQMTHSTETMELKQQLKDYRRKYETVRDELNETKSRLSSVKADINSSEDQLKQMNTKYNQAIRVNDEQQTKILSVMKKHSQESEELRQQRNQFEQLYEEHKQSLHTTKEEIHRLRNELEHEKRESKQEKSKLQQALDDSKREMKLLREHEAEKTRHLKNALETYLIS